MARKKLKKDFNENISDAIRPQAVKPSYIDPVDIQSIPNVQLSLGQENSELLPEFKEKSKKPFMGEISTRSTVWDYFRTTISLPIPSEVLQTLGKNIEEWDQLWCDARFKAAYNNRRAGLLGLQWTIDQAGASARPYKIIKKIFESLPVYDIMASMMKAPFYGYDVSEVIWEVKENLYIPTKIQGKAARWFVYRDDNTLAYKTKVNMVQGEPLPPRKMIVTRMFPTYDDPYASREGIANACYWPVKFRHMIQEFAIQFLEKYGCPWIDVEYDGQLQPERAQEIVNQIQSTFNDGIIAHSSESVIKPINIGDAKTIENYSKWTDVMNREIDMAVLGTNLMTEVKSGSHAAAAVHSGVRDDIIQQDRRMIEASMNQLIEWVYWYNFNTDESLPKFKLHKSEPPSKEKAEIDMMMAQMGIKFNKEYFERVYGYNAEDFEVGEPPAAKLASSLPTGAIPTQITDEDGNKTISEENDADEINTEILEVALDSKEQAKNNLTKEAYLRSQAKGYPY